MAELPERVESVTVSVPSFPMPPPLLNSAELPERVEFVTVSVPSFSMPSPDPPGAELPDRVDVVTVRRRYCEFRRRVRAGPSCPREWSL